jgi:hypothetical protein
VVHKPRKINPKLKMLIKIELEKILEARIIISIENLEWIANLEVVGKKNGEILTLCGLLGPEPSLPQR